MTRQSPFANLTPAQIIELGRGPVGAPTRIKQIAPVERGKPLVLSFAQQRLWFLAQMEGVSQAYNIPLALRLGGGLDEIALRRALDRLVARHEALRTRFVAVDGEPHQEVGPADQGLALTGHDLRGNADARSRLEGFIGQEASEPFDLRTGPLVRGRLIKMGDQEHVLLLTMHHIVSDGWSMGILNRELQILYEAYARGEEDPLEPLAIQYPDYAAWQRHWLSGDVLRRQSEYWRAKLAGAPALLELPTDRYRSAHQDLSGGFVGLELTEDLTAGLKALSQSHGMTLFMTLLAAWGLVLSRLSGQTDLVIGTPSANRARSEVEDLVGFFVNPLALRLDLSGSPTVSQMLERVRAVSLEAQDHQDLPFEQVVELARPIRSLAHAPIFQVMFDWQGHEAAIFKPAGLIVEDLDIWPASCKYDLTLSLGESEQRVGGGIEYASALFDADTVERYGHYLRRTLEQMSNWHSRAYNSASAGM